MIHPWVREGNSSGFMSEIPKEGFVLMRAPGKHVSLILLRKPFLEGVIGV